MRRLMFSLVLAAAGLALMAAGASRAEAGIAPQAGEPTPAPQEVTGEGLYRLYCISCHGERMRGLTAEWIAQWPATHQNCWLAKCHGPNPPPDGFTLPRQAPAIAGPSALLKFRTAADLHAYIQVAMPFQEPGRLTEDQYWDIAVYVLTRHGVNDLPDRLTGENAREVELNPGLTVEVVPTVVDELPPETPGTPGLLPIALLGVGAVGSLSAAILLVLRKRSRES